MPLILPFSTNINEPLVIFAVVLKSGALPLLAHEPLDAIYIPLSDSFVWLNTNILSPAIIPKPSISFNPDSDELPTVATFTLSLKVNPDEIPSTYASVA